MLRKISLMISILVGMTAVNLSAQKAVLSFSNKKHDFGTIQERAGNAVYSFELKNTGNAPLIIQRVSASCGCTTPEWTQTPIEPGKTGYVKASYNPVGRPGSFTKSITVYSNASNEVETLIITGNVNSGQSAAPNVQQHSFPEKIGQLSLNTKTVQFGNVNKGSVSSRVIAIHNGTSNALSIDVANLPPYLTVALSSKSLQPNEQGSITIDINAGKVAEWGPVEDAINLVLNGKKEIAASNSIKVSATVNEDFSNLSAAQKRLAPILEVKSYNLFLGNIKKGNKVRGAVAVKNSGSNALEVRRVVNNNSDIIVHPLRASIKGGHSESFKIDVNTKFLQVGEYRKVFTLQTNDPNNSIVTFNVSYKVI